MLHDDGTATAIGTSSMTSLQWKHPQLEPVHYQQILKAITELCLLAFNKSSVESPRHQCHLEDATLFDRKSHGCRLNRSTIVAAGSNLFASPEWRILRQTKTTTADNYPTKLGPLMKCCTGFPKAVLPVAAGCFAGKIISPFY
jgi:hypothetical protein